MSISSADAPQARGSVLPTALMAAPDAEIYQQGFLAEGTEQYELAVACFAEIRQRQPDNPYVLLDLARVHFHQLDFEAAQAHLADAVARGGEDADFCYQLALIYQAARYDAEAEACFRRAIHGDASNSELSAALIGFYESRGLLPQAEAEVQRIEQQAGGTGLITALKGIVLLQAGKRAAAMPALEHSLSERPERKYQIHARYALARALAETGREAESLECLYAAKARQEVALEVPRLRQTNQEIMRSRAEARRALTATDVRTAWRAEAHTGERPLVFLLGYPRSGTTLLEQVVESHSAVHSLEETSAFMQSVRQEFQGKLAAGENAWEVISQADAATRERARQRYFEYLHRLGAPRDRSVVLLDKNPGLTGHVHLLARLFPNAKFLVMVRDPRDICLSAFQTQVVLSPFSVNWLRWSDTVRHCVHILDHWVALRERLPNPFLEVRYEDLVANLPQTGQRVMEFLGLPWESPQENFAAHARSRAVYSPTRYDVRNELSARACGKWRRFHVDYSAGEPGLTALLERYGYAPFCEGSQMAPPPESFESPHLAAPSLLDHGSQFRYSSGT